MLQSNLEPEKILVKQDIIDLLNDDKCNIAVPKEGEDNLATTGEVVMAELQQSNGQGVECIKDEVRDSTIGGEINMDGKNALQVVLDSMLDSTEGTEMSPAEREIRKKEIDDM